MLHNKDHRITLIRQYTCNGLEVYDEYTLTGESLPMLAHQADNWCKRNGYRIIARDPKKVCQITNRIPCSKYERIYVIR